MKTIQLRRRHLANDYSWLRNAGVLTEKENQAMYKYMEGRSYKEVGEIMDLSRSRIHQMISKYQRDCKQEGKSQLPRRQEVDELLPQIDLIKSIYEN